MKTNILAVVGAVIVAGNLSLSFAAVPTKYREPLKFTDLPAAVQRTVNAQAGATGITSIDRVTRNGVPLYEVRLNQPGNNQPIYISETGSLIAPENVIGSRPGQDGSRKAAFNELPAAVQNTVRAQAGNAQIEDIDVVTKNGQTSYDVAFKRAGQTVELWVDPTGNVLSGGLPATAAGTTVSQARANLSAATKANLSDLPAAAQNTIRTYSLGAEIEDIDKGTLQGRVVYEAAFKNNGQNIELRVAEDGSLIHDDVNDQYLASIGKAPPGVSGPNVATASAFPAGTDWKNAPARVPLSAASKVNFREMPSVVRNTLRNYSGTTRIEDIDKGTLNGRTVYEAAFKDRGRNIELRIAEDGTLIMDQPNAEFLSQFDRQFPGSAVGRAPSYQGVTGSGAVSPAGARTLNFEQLPAAVQTTMRNQAGASAIENIQQTSINGRTVYQAIVKPGDRDMQIQVEENGSLTR